MESASAGEKVSNEAKNAHALVELQETIMRSVESDPKMEKAMRAVMEVADYRHLGMRAKANFTLLRKGELCSEYFLREKNALDKPVKKGQFHSSMLREPKDVPQTPYHLIGYSIHLTRYIRDSLLKSVELLDVFGPQRENSDGLVVLPGQAKKKKRVPFTLSAVRLSRPEDQTLVTIQLKDMKRLEKAHYKNDRW